MILEVCCGSAEDVLIAAQAGAHRVELNSALFLGGLTPSIGAMTVARQVSIPIMAMVRPRQGGFCYTEMEFETMLEDARLLLENGADGIVFGCLQEDGRIDAARCRKLLEVIGDKESVFHRAIDVTPDWKEALDTLIELGVTRVLTSGQAPSVLYGMETVRDMVAYAAGRIEILPGAGIRPGNVRQILSGTGCSQFHCSASGIAYDRSTENSRGIFFGGALYPPEDRYSTTDLAAVEAYQGVL